MMPIILILRFTITFYPYFVFLRRTAGMPAGMRTVLCSSLKVGLIIYLWWVYSEYVQVKKVLHFVSLSSCTEI